MGNELKVGDFVRVIDSQCPGLGLRTIHEIVDIDPKLDNFLVLKGNERTLYSVGYFEKLPSGEDPKTVEYVALSLLKAHLNSAWLSPDVASRAAISALKELGWKP